jgi:tetratricopeptide (TPR) repeat protein
VEEGIANNPDAFTLHIMRGRIMIAQERYAEAVADFAAARDAALKIRTPQGEEKPGIWSESDEEDFATALRMIPMLQLRKLNQPEQARVAVEEGLKYVPRDHSLNLFSSELRDSATVLHN